ncbi:MAG: EAL domain-containing protein [Lachnospiraceae bacterium]|nr:EAL domain-containing protein [Lachnospiraceae bacterium]
MEKMMRDEKQMDSGIGSAELHSNGNKGKEDVDALTSFYTWPSAEKRIAGLMGADPAGNYHMILLHVGNIPQLAEEYSYSYAVTVLENQAILLQRYFSLLDEVVFCRIARDAFLVFTKWEDAREVEEHCRSVYEKLGSCYSGRREKPRCRPTMGIYHVPTGEQDLQKILKCCGKAVEYGLRCQLPYVVYDESMADETLHPNKDVELERLTAEKLTQYDNRFITFAVSLLADTTDLDSSLDMLLQRLAWQFAFDEVLISEFIGDNSTMVTNKWRREEGVLLNPEEITSLDIWDDFFVGFNKEGINLSCDVEKTGYSRKDMAFFHEKQIGSFMNLLLYKNGQPIGFMTCNRRQAIEQVPEEELFTLIQVSKIIGSFVALRIQNRCDQEHIEALGRDDLTGLYYYSFFVKEVRRILYQYDPSQTYAMVYMDISNFAYLNENFSYSEGDQLLKDMARWLRYMNARRCICCRIHADRFALLVTADSQEAVENQVRRSVSRFSDYLQNRYPMGDLQVRAGIYYIDNPEAEIFTMIDAANHARKTIKDDYLNHVVVYTDQLRQIRAEKTSVVASIHDAIEKGYVEAYLQPKFSMNTGEVIGAEALVRWRNEDGSMKYPDQFVPVLEEVGYIVDLDFCVFRQVLACLKRWKEEGRRRVPISVNFSRIHFRNPHFCDKVVALLREYEVEPEYIEIEVTESCFSSNRTEMIRQMSLLREHGLKIDMDDFGTGYSSLGMLVDASVDIVKIDKSFIDHYETDQEQQYINRIGQLVKAAGKDIIFEGVETQQQITFLRGFGYDKAQGYVFSRPVPISEFERWM